MPENGRPSDPDREEKSSDTTFQNARITQGELK